jgi:hypothetical protein
VARHQDALARGEEVAYEVGDRVRIPRSWRSLYQNALVGAESFDDLELLLVGRGAGNRLRCLQALRLACTGVSHDLDQAPDPFR